MEQLSDFRPRGVIFDIDGTLTDNMPWHEMAFKTFVRRHNLPDITMEVRRRIDGKRNLEILPILFDREMTTEEIAEYEEEKEQLYRDLSKDALQPLPGLATLLGELARHGIPVAVATSAPAKNVGHTLEALGLARDLSVIARADEVGRGKPFPDVFLHAARLIGAPPGGCLAFEDALIGVEAAHRAGMRCVALTTSYPAAEFAASATPPDAACADFDAFLAGAGRWLLRDPP